MKKFYAKVLCNGCYDSNVGGKVYSYYPYAAGNDTQDGAAIPVSVAANQGTGQSDGVRLHVWYSCRRRI